MGEIWALRWTSDAGNAAVLKTAEEAIVADETSVAWPDELTLHNFCQNTAKKKKF